MGNNPPRQPSTPAPTQTRQVGTAPMRRPLETETKSRNPAANRIYVLTAYTALRPRVRTTLTPSTFDAEPSNSSDNLKTGPNVDSDPENWPNTLTAEQEERCYDPNDTRFTFVDGEDEMDFELNEYKSLRAKMSCGHTVTPTSLINWCRKQLDQGKVQFVCGQPNCDAVWSFEDVCKMALLTPAETKYIDRRMFNRVAKEYFGAKKCPGCESLVVRKDQNNLRVCCTVCTRNKRRVYEFCWQCLKKWTHPSEHADYCANPECVNQPLEILRKCPEINFKNVRMVTGCPSVRACPTCGFLIEHSGKKCNHIKCPRCKEEFCFVCLSTVCYSYFRACNDGVAPRQTSIPVWKRK
ncbi:potential E3 ubiquitin-protein ligase ariadne-2-like [Labrus bergylta]|uniref:potential E3 ubiquitin-protein ligase ariadne-2-like n=1 Tax=Labrus bergylta TaxID=56723 RepID=UPI0033142AB4